MARKRTRTTLREQAELAAQGGAPDNSALSAPEGRYFASGEVDDLRVRAYYPPTRQFYDASPYLRSMSWTDSVSDLAAVQATLDFDSSDGYTARYLNRPGMVFFIEARPPGGNFRELLRLVAWDTAISDVAGGSMSITAYDHLIYLQVARGSFKYTKDKRHRKGWTASEIVADICRKHRIPTLKLIKTTYRIPSFVLADASLYEAIAAAYSVDSRKSKKQYFIEAQKGRLVIRRRRQLRATFVVADDSNLRSGAFSRSLGSPGEPPFGSVVVSGDVAKGADGKPVKTTSKKSPKETRKQKRRREQAQARRRERVQRARRRGESAPSLNPKRERKLASAMLFGAMPYNRYGRRTVRDPDYSKDAAQALSDRLARAVKTLSISADGNTHVRQGDRIFVRLPFGPDTVLRKAVFVSSVTHTIQPGDYSMDIECAWRELEVATRMDMPEQEEDPGTGGAAGSNVTLAERAAAAEGFTGTEWEALKELWQRESGFDHTATNPQSGAYGIPQALPPEKMAAAGDDWRTNPATQIAWGLSYIKERYGLPSAALAHHTAKNWY